ncbi:cyclic lactone autoinducer peptide [Paenibacillus sp. SORGH_AS306]|nr:MULTISPECIES: cyclic lactone autoinducer peptide [unclassified Paenibacillus]MDQ1236713.1 cyclic lactone autoinducer peptide [Paenibacillus sp. SORGH_AS_0306]MDR6109070.1 cyclic lactone autoinducer peptide [Paenibacillus sp. SORGH_AS_0338]
MRLYGAIATALASLAMYFVSTASINFIYSPEVPEN